MGRRNSRTRFSPRHSRSKAQRDKSAASPGASAGPNGARECVPARQLQSRDARKQSQTSVAFYCPERCERVVLPCSRDQPRRSELFHSDRRRIARARVASMNRRHGVPGDRCRNLFRRRPGPGGSVKRSAQSATSSLVAQQIETKLVLRDHITAVWFELWGDGYQGRAERFDFGPHMLQRRQLRICSRVTICIGRNLLRPAPL